MLPSRHWLLAALLFAVAPAAAAREAAGRPNVVVILADDQGWGDLSVHGNTNLATPNVDSLARDGAIFDRFFVCPVCSPTRAEFLTGRYHPRGGVHARRTGGERLNLDEKTIADALQGRRLRDRRRSASGTTARSTRTTRTPAASTSITASPPATGATTSTRRWSTTAGRSAARASSSTT